MIQAAAQLVIKGEHQEGKGFKGREKALKKKEFIGKICIV